jgi:Transposase DDE domain group 1
MPHIRTSGWLVIRFRSNEVRLWLSVIAYNLGDQWRWLVLPKRIDNWSLTSLQQRLVKAGGRLVKHARYYWLLLAQSHLTRRSMVRRIEALPSAIGVPIGSRRAH